MNLVIENNHILEVDGNHQVGILAQT